MGKISQLITKKVVKRVLIAGGTIVGLAVVGALLKPSKDTEEDNQTEEQTEDTEVQE